MTIGVNCDINAEGPKRGNERLAANRDDSCFSIVVKGVVAEATPCVAVSRPITSDDQATKFWRVP